MLYAKKRNLKLNKLNKISGLSRWEAKATKHKQGVRIRQGSGGPAQPPVCGEALRPGSGVRRLR